MGSVIMMRSAILASTLLLLAACGENVRDRAGSKGDAPAVTGMQDDAAEGQAPGTEVEEVPAE